MLRNNRRLQVPVVTHQVLHDLEQVGERLYPVHEILGRDIAAAYRFERLSDQSRSVMKNWPSA